MKIKVKKIGAQRQEDVAPISVGSGRSYLSPMRYKNLSELTTKYYKARSIRGSGQAFANIIRQYEQTPYQSDGRILPNFGTMRGKVDKAMSTYIDFSIERERWAKITTDFGDDDAVMGMWNEHITSAFQKYCLDRWKRSFADNMLAIRDMLLMSKGAFFFCDDDSCYPERVGIQNVIPDSSAGMFPESFDTMFIHRRMSAIELYRKVQNQEASDINGWNKDAVLSLLKTTQASWRSYTHESLFLLFGSGRITQSQQDATIDLVFAYVKEYDEDSKKNSVSQFIFPVLRGIPQLNEAGLNPEIDKLGYLFYKRAHKKSMDQVVSLVAHQVAENFWEDQSFAQRIYTLSKTYDMVMNRVLQGIEDNMRVFLQSDSPESQQSLQRMRIGNWQVLKPGQKLQQDRIVRPIMESLQVLNKLMVDTNASFGQYTTGEQEGRAMPKTAKQSEIDFGESQVISTSQIKLYNCYYAILMEEMYRRFVTLGEASQLTETEQKNYKRFVAYLERRKVPKDAWLTENTSVASVLLAGAGSPQEKLKSAAIIQQALTIVASTPGEKLVKRQMIGAAVGVSNVSAYLPDDDTMLIGEDSLIGLENDALSVPDCNPQNIPVINDQLHLRHIPRHLEDASLSLQTAGKLYQSLGQMPKEDMGVYLKTIQDILIGVDNKMAHTQAHMQVAAKDKNPRVQASLKQTGAHMQQIQFAQDQLEKAISQAQTDRMKQSQDGQNAPTPEMNHQSAMFQMKEAHAQRMMDFEFQTAGMKAEQLRTQSAENAIHKKSLETTLAAQDLQMQNLQNLIKLSVVKQAAAIKTSKAK